MKAEHLVVESGAEKKTGIPNMKKVWLLRFISVISLLFMDVCGVIAP